MSQGVNYSSCKSACGDLWWGEGWWAQNHKKQDLALPIPPRHRDSATARQRIIAPKMRRTNSTDDPLHTDIKFMLIEHKSIHKQGW